MSYQIKSAVFITYTYKNSYEIHFNPNQSALFMTLILSSTSKKTCETLAGRTLFEIRNPSRIAQFLDAGRSLHTPAIRGSAHMCSMIVIVT